MLLGLASLDQRWQDRAANFIRCSELVHEARSKGCKLVVFPEMTLTGYSLDTDVVAELAADSASLKMFGELAEAASMHILFGVCLVNPATGRPRNMLCHAGPAQGATPVYAKMHPFSFAGEDKVFEAGSQPEIIDLPGIRLGVSICYDLRFPELYAAIAPRCDATVCIANWPDRRVAHWRSLMVARAIENQMFMFGVNRIGSDGNGLSYEKSSMAVEPDGTVLEPAHSGKELDLYEVDPEKTRCYRQEFPTLRDKRSSLYAGWARLS